MNLGVGDFVRIKPSVSDDQNIYEVASVQIFRSGVRIGVYNKPPTKSIQFWSQEHLIHCTPDDPSQNTQLL